MIPAEGRRSFMRSSRWDVRSTSPRSRPGSTRRPSSGGLRNWVAIWVRAASSRDHSSGTRWRISSRTRMGPSSPERARSSWHRVNGSGGGDLPGRRVDGRWAALLVDRGAAALQFGPVQGRNPLGLRLLRRFRLARTVEGDRLANERLEGGLVNLFAFVDVDRAACVSVETRVEETGRILQRRALREGKLHDTLVGFAGADDAVVRPNGSAHPLPLLDEVRVFFLDELAHSAEGSPAPVPEFGDSFRDELRCRLALARV